MTQDDFADSPAGFLNEIPEEDELLIYSLVPEIRDLGDLQRYQMAEAWVRLLSEMRKEQNDRLMQFEKRWAARKGELREQIVSFLNSQGKHADGARKVTTILGTTYLTEKKDWTASITNEELAIATLQNLLDTNEISIGCHRECVELKPVLTDRGRELLKQLAIDRAKATGELLPGTDAKPPRDIINTRFAKSVNTRFLDRQMMGPMLRNLPKVAAKTGPLQDQQAKHDPFTSEQAED